MKPIIMPAILLILFAASTLYSSAAAASDPVEDASSWPRRVLVTNDNGIDDTGMVELARALAKVTETHVVAATTDRSGTTNLMSVVRSGEFRVERRDIGEGIEAWALDGYPADCVLFALSGPMRERPPDLVISGINGGPNLGDSWLGSGTIGAARTAAYMGIPAIAVSGLEDDDPAAVRAAVQWVVELIRSEVVRSLRPPQYLTVSLPIVNATEITGVEVVPRARGLITGLASPVGEASAGGLQTWRLDLVSNPDAAPRDSDVAANARQAIAIVPMRVDEFDPGFLVRLRENPAMIPGWSAPEPMADTEPTCRSGFGAVFDDAEDSSGREWGVLLEALMAGGKAEEAGLRVGDVIVSLNDIALEVDRRAREDPDDRFLRLLNQLGCGETVALEYVRDGERYRTGFRTPEAPKR